MCFVESQDIIRNKFENFTEKFTKFLSLIRVKIGKFHFFYSLFVTFVVCTHNQMITVYLFTTNFIARSGSSS